MLKIFIEGKGLKANTLLVQGLQAMPTVLLMSNCKRIFGDIFVTSLSIELTLRHLGHLKVLDEF